MRDPVGNTVEVNCPNVENPARGREIEKVEAEAEGAELYLDRR